MNKPRFKCLFAFRNISTHKKNSLVVILTLSLVFSLLMLILGMRFTFSKIYEYQLTNEYQEIDVVMTYDEYSSAKLINRRYVTDNFQDRVENSLVFFNLDVLVENHTGNHYASLMSAAPNEFETLVGQDISLGSRGAIITQTYADQYGVGVGDTIRFDLMSSVYDYHVSAILPDTGLFSGVTFYVDKAQLFDDIFNLGYLTNLGNTIYVYTKDGVDISGLVTDMKADSVFATYSIFPTVDKTYIDYRARDLTSMMLAVSLIVLIAVVMVLDSLFPIVNLHLRQQLGVTRTLGAKKRFMWHVNLLQWLMYGILSFIIAIGLSLLVINYGLHVYGIDGYIPLQWSTMALAFIGVMIFVVFRAWLSFRREIRASIAAESRSRRFVVYKTRYWLLAIALLLLVLEFIMHPFKPAYHSLIIVLLSVYLTLNLLSLVLVYVSKWIEKKGKRSLFSIFQVKYLKKNKHIHQSLRVIFISLIALIMVFSVRKFMFGEIDLFYDVVRFDLAIVNVNDYSSALKDEVMTYDVTRADEAVFYDDILIHFPNDKMETSKFFVSMDYPDLTHYFGFNFDIQDIDPAYISDTIPYVILPIDFKWVYDMDVGDMVTIDLNHRMENIPMVIAGFINTNFDNIVYSNIMHVAAYQQTAVPNTIFVNTADKANVFQAMVRDFGGRMYYVLDPLTYFNGIIASVGNITDFFTVFSMFMIICFIIIIFNNVILVFYGLKNDLAKVKVLGAGRRLFRVSLFKEFLLMLTIVLVVGVPEILILSNHLKYVVLLTDFYKDISSPPLTIAYGCAIVGVVLFISYTYYYYNIGRLKILEEIKIY